jgi:CDP-2,3-bis-(O-geranylgeranyl)-sn-glycerol synthase
MTDSLLALLLFLPAAIANAAPVFANKIPGFNRWDTPIDVGKSYRGKRVLGDNKTWRGLCSGTIAGMLTGLAVYFIYPGLVQRFEIAPLVPVLDMAIIGAALGFGALLGDTVESFFKRQRNVSSGSSWFPFDQTDYILGGLLFVWPVIHLSLRQAIAIFVAYFSLHLVGSYIGYLLKLKDRPI